jgi:5-methylcytosine-specific restriction endonuclease McrA
MRSSARQLAIWDDRTFDAPSARNFRRTPQQARVDYYRAYLQSPQWECRRRETIVRAKFRCERCGKVRRLQVHHLTYSHVGDEYPDQLVAVCVRCHIILTELEREVRQDRGC